MDTPIGAFFFAMVLSLLIFLSTLFTPSSSNLLSSNDISGNQLDLRFSAGTHIVREASQQTTYQRGIMSQHVIATDSSVKLDILNFNGVGEYELSDGSTAILRMQDGKARTLSTDDKHVGLVRVTAYDPHKQELSGEFSATVADREGHAERVTGTFRLAGR